MFAKYVKKLKSNCRYDRRMGFILDVGKTKGFILDIAKMKAFILGTEKTKAFI